MLPSTFPCKDFVIFTGFLAIILFASFCYIYKIMAIRGWNCMERSSISMINKFVEQRIQALNLNNEQKSKKITPPQAAASTTIKKDSHLINDTFVKEQRKNGLVEKFYDYVKGTIGFGVSSKKVKQKITEYESGKISEKDINTTISKYRSSQENAEQGFGDTVSAVGALGTYFGLTNTFKSAAARFKLGAIPGYDKSMNKLPVFSQLNSFFTENTKTSAHKVYSGIGKSTGNIIKLFKRKSIDTANKAKKPLSKKPLPKFISDIINKPITLTPNKKFKMIAIPAAMYIGGMAKLFTLKFNRIGSQEFKVENKESLSKKEFKAAKKELGKKRFKENTRNLFTGTLNGLLAPIAGLAGGLAGVPAYLAATSGIRYFFKEDKNKDGDNKKSLNGYLENFKDTAVVSTATTLAIGALAYKKANYSKVLSANLNKVVSKFKNVSLKTPELVSGKTAFNEIEDMVLGSKGIKKILDNADNLSVEQQILKLTDENFFAVKFLQIKDNSIKGLSGSVDKITSKLIENCPPTRTLKEAQLEVNKLIGSNKYKLEKLTAVGTVAESYFAKNSSGKEVCIKILKKGIDGKIINAEKIQRDKESIIKLITKGKPAEQLNEKQKYLVKNVENMAEGVSKEFDFVHEMKAAQELKKFTKKADVVTPIEAKPGIYVMEKAPGISLDTLSKYYSLQAEKKFISKINLKNKEKHIAKIDSEIKKVKERSPDFENFDLKPQQIKKLLYNYIDVLTEQFTKIERNGKVVHADIHPGNIFINLKALQSGKGKLFTLIDTGNTINLTKEQSAVALKLTSFLKKGNVDDIVKVSLDDAILPQGMSPEHAKKLVTKDMKQIFFDKTTKINSMSTDEFFKLFNNVSRKHNIIPNNTQLSMDKAKKSADNSFKKLMKNFFEQKYSHLDEKMENASKAEAAKQVSRVIKDVALIAKQKPMIQAAQETKNLFKMSPREAWNHLFNRNNLKSNSEDLLTYKFKQHMTPKAPEMP